MKKIQAASGAMLMLMSIAIPIYAIFGVLGIVNMLAILGPTCLFFGGLYLLEKSHRP